MDIEELRKQAEKIVDPFLEGINITTDVTGRTVSHIVSNIAIKPIGKIIEELNDTISYAIRNFRENRKSNAIHKQYCDAFVAEHGYMVSYIINSDTLDKEILSMHILRLACLKACSQLESKNDTLKIDAVVKMLEQKVLPLLENK